MSEPDETRCLVHNECKNECKNVGVSRWISM